MNGVDYYLLKGFVMYIYIIIWNIVIFFVFFVYLFVIIVFWKGVEILSEFKFILSV